MSESTAPIVMYGKSHVTAALSSRHPKVGTFKQFDGEDYVWAYTACNSQINPGYVCIPQSGMSLASVTLSSTTNSGRPFGIVKHSTMTTGTYCWLLRRGVVEVEMNGTSGTVASGGDIGVGANGVCTPVTIATGILSPAFGQALEAIVSGASGSAYVSIY